MNDRSPLQASGRRGSRLTGPSTGGEVPAAGIVVTGAAGLIGLVAGGRSGERDRSLLSAEALAEALQRQNLRYARLDPCDGEFADRIRLWTWHSWRSLGSGPRTANFRACWGCR